MKFHLGLLVIGLCFSYTQAQSFQIRDIGLQQKRTEAAESLLNTFRRDVIANQEAINKINNEYEAALANYEAQPTTKTSQACPKGVMASVFGVGCTESTESIEIPANIKARYDAALKEKEKLADLEKQKVSLNKAIHELEIQQTNAKGAVANLSNEQKGQIRELDSAIGNLKTDLNSAKIDLLQSNQILDRIQDAYDKTVLGAYLKDKMAKLISSDAMCEAQRMCSSGVSKTTRADKAQELLSKELFPSAKVSRTGSASAKATNTQGTK